MKKALTALLFPILLPITGGLLAAADPPEIVVGRHPGPPPWRVSSGDNVLWIFPDLAPAARRTWV
ncbi:MAG TPA: hypothetical protein VGE69_16285 [Pseudomonadales bacterium]